MFRLLLSTRFIWSLCTALPLLPAVLLAGRVQAQITLTPGPPAASIVISTATAVPGNDVSVEATLHTLGAPIAGTQNDITFDIGAAIVAAANGRPDCAVNPLIGKPSTGFSFFPHGCTPSVDCTMVRALVLSVDNVDPIPDGAVLYTCTVRIGDRTPPGSYPLTVSQQLASDPDGNQIALGGVDGGVVVTTAPGATPLPTWTAAPSPQPTATYSPVPAPSRTIPAMVDTPLPASTPVPGDFPTPTPRSAGGEACDNGSACGSGFCVNHMCCDSTRCQPGQRCDVAGFEGICAPIPTPAAPSADDPAETASTSQSRMGSGCQLDFSDDGAGGLLLMALPVFLAMQRYRRF